MQDLSADIVIVGGGPAGASAAIEADRLGLSTIVIDKATFPRDKCCGDGLTTGALRQLENIGFDPSTVPSWQTVTNVCLNTPSGRETVLQLPGGASDNSVSRPGTFAAVARRQELDAALLNQASATSALVLQGHELVGLEQTTSNVAATVKSEGGTRSINARYLVAADGMWSPTRRMLGVEVDGYRGDWHAFRQYFTNVSERAQQDLIIWFERDLLPGYVWSFPLADGSANVGFGIHRKGVRSVQFMNDLWPRILARPHIRNVIGTNAEAEDRHRAWPIPARLGQVPLSLGRTLFVGDAGASTDPMTGEGIGQAIETGRLAASCFSAAGFDNPAEARRQYEDYLHKGMVRDHGLARGLSTLLARPSGVEVSVAAIRTTDWTRRNFARWLFEDYPRASLVTPHRWKRRLFNADGAFAAGTGVAD